MAKRSVVVQVGGQRYVVRSDADDSYIQELARYVDDRLELVQLSSRPVSTQSRAVLAALNIADELFQERRRRSELKRRLSDRSKAVIAYLDKEVKARLEVR